MQWLVDILKYVDAKPLDFMQLFFWGFFLVVMVVFSLIYRHRAARNTFLFFVSLYFYYKTAGVFFTLLIFTVLLDYSFGLWMDRMQTEWKRKLLLTLSLVLNLSLLCYFKYALLFTDTFNQIFHSDIQVFNYFAWFFNETGMTTGMDVHKIFVPVGISFYTFQSISYIMDIYRREIRPVRNLLDYGFFVSFFPQLVAGPIVRAHDFIPQMSRRYRLSRTDFGIAMFWILNGAVKKALLANYLADNFIDRIFTQPTLYTGYETLMSLYAYSLQVYGDFSGYTDIAIGVAMLMGFSLRKNFDSPYKARNPAEFWKRWHISLSSWLQDYLYKPLGGSRRFSLFTWLGTGMVLVAGGYIFRDSLPIYLGVLGVAVTALVVASLLWRSVFKEIYSNLNVMLTMLIGGIWHGPTWNFMLWGGLNGIGIVLYKVWNRLVPKIRDHFVLTALGVFITFNFISLTRIFFRAREWDKAMLVLDQLWNNLDFSFAGAVTLGYWKVMLVMVAGLVIHWLPEDLKRRYRYWFSQLPLWAMLLITVLAVVFIVQVVNASHQRFIYFDF